MKNHWEELLGKERVKDLPSMERAVDIAMGLVAKSWGEYGDFSKNLNARQPDKETQASVHESVYGPSMRHLPDATKSVVKSTAGGMDRTSLSRMFDDAIKSKRK